MIEINILPTYCELADDAELEIFKNKLPKDFKPFKHQLETYKAYNNKDITVIFNTSMTGAGKSFAGFLPLIDDNYLIASYPTNELISDQLKNFKNYEIFKHLKENKDYGSLFGMKITLEMLNSIIQDRFRFINRELENKKITFTNPDITHLMVGNKYGYIDWQQETIPMTINNRVDYFIFDEFHIFETPQVVSIVNDMAYILSRNENKKFIFLSATPKVFFKEMLERLDIGYVEISGNYSSKFIEGKNRKILHEIDLYINCSDNTVDWIKEHFELIKKELIYYKLLGKKSAIIVNSIIGSKEIYKFIESKNISNFKIIENNGLSSDIDKTDFRNELYDLVIGTSTIDIGIDFDINFLIFEANTQENFLQRLGRLGRVKSNNINTSDNYKAFSIIPEKIYRNLEKADFCKQNIERSVFNSNICNIFPEKNSLKKYINKWGSIQACSIIERGTKDQEVKNSFIEKFNKLYTGYKLSRVKTKFYAIANKKPEIIATLNSFRGVNNFQCAIYDTDKIIKTYDLLFILKNAKADFFDDIEDFEDRFGNLNEQDKLKIKYCNFFAEIKDYKDVSDYFYFDNVGTELKYGCLDVTNKFKVDSENKSNPNLININKQLQKIKMVYFIVCNKHSISELKNKLKLSFNFKLFSLKDGSVIAFNQEALILDAIIPNIPTFRRPEEQCFII